MNATIQTGSWRGFFNTKIATTFALAGLLLSSVANASATTTIGINNWANDVVVGYSGGYVLGTGAAWDPLAGNINGNAGTQVNTLFKFNISSISSVGRALFTIRPLSVEGTTSQVIGVASYNVGLTSAAFAVDGNNNNVDLLNVNWVAGKRTLQGTYPVTNGVTTSVTIDVTLAVQEAKSNGWSYVTLDMFNVSGGSGSGYDIQAGADGNTHTWFYSANGASGGPTLEITPAIDFPRPPDNTVNIGNWGSDVVVGFSGGYVLGTGATWDPLAGNINGNPGTQVNTLFKFDISAISGSVTSAVVTIRPLSVEGTVNQTIGLASYNVGLTSAAFAVDGNNNNADLLNVNWVAGKRTLLDTFTTWSTATDGTGTDKTPVTIDVTAAVRTAQSNGWSYVTFDLFNVSGGSGSGYDLMAGATGNTHTYFYSANGANGGPALAVWVATVAPPVLGITKNGSNLQITWSVGHLESNTNLVNGTWSTVTGAVSPLVVSPTDPVRFYRAVNP